MEEIGVHIPPVKVYADKFEGQVVVVTGAAQGIGEVTATLFATQGATVILVDLNEKGLDNLSSKLNLQGAKTFTQVCNVGNDAEVDSLINELATIPRPNTVAS
jgi:NAD(P)-dependent dehydrogenase (short-subunit alcohol dehydrogenase family)